jgi:Flp pilus assembly protein TadD
MPLRLIAIVAVIARAHLTALPSFAAGSDDVGSELPASGDLAKAQDLLKANNFAAAADELKLVAAADAGNADVWNLLGFAQRKSGDLKAAGKSYAKALGVNPDHIGALEYQGELFVMTGQLDRAKANLDRLNNLCGNCEEAEDLAKALAKAGG